MEIKVGEIIKAKREERGWSLAEFAKRIGISTGYLSQIENGRKTNPRLDIILRIIHELDIDIRMLLGIESGEENYLSRIPSLLKLTLARDRILKTLSDKDVLRRINDILNKLCEARYILEDQDFYNMFLDESSNQIESILKRYMALRILLNK